MSALGVKRTSPPADLAVQQPTKVQLVINPKLLASPCRQPWLHAPKRWLN